MAQSGRPSNNLLIAALVISVLSISSAATLIRIADAPALVVASARMLIASIILWVLAPFLKVSLFRGINWRRALGAGFFLALHFGFWISSLDSTSVASSLVLVTMNPIVVALGSTFLLKDPPGKPLVLGTIISIIGCIVLVVGEGFDLSGPLTGNLLALGGAFAMSCYMMIGRTVVSDGNFFGYVTWVNTFSGLFLLIWGVLTGVQFHSYPGKTMFFILLIALVPQLVGHSLINWSLKYLHTSYLSAAILVEPLAGTIIAYLVLGEEFSRFSFYGGVLILFGVGLAFRRSSSVFKG